MLLLPFEALIKRGRLSQISSDSISTKPQIMLCSSCGELNTFVYKLRLQETLHCLIEHWSTDMIRLLQVLFRTDFINLGGMYMSLEVALSLKVTK